MKYQVTKGIFEGTTFNGTEVNGRVINEDSTGQSFPVENCVQVPEHNQEVIILDPWKYVSDCFRGMTGIVVRHFENGCNVWLSGMNGGGTYQDQIFYFPYGTFEIKK